MNDQSTFEQCYAQAKAALSPHKRALLAQMEALQQAQEQMRAESLAELLAALERDRRDCINYLEALASAISGHDDDAATDYVQRIANLALRIETRTKLILDKPEWAQSESEAAQ